MEQAPWGGAVLGGGESFDLSTHCEAARGLEWLVSVPRTQADQSPPFPSELPLKLPPPEGGCGASPLCLTPLHSGFPPLSTLTLSAWGGQDRMERSEPQTADVASPRQPHHPQ